MLETVKWIDQWIGTTDFFLNGETEFISVLIVPVQDPGNNPVNF